jgi:hypothetical protein
MKQHRMLLLALGIASVAQAQQLPHVVMFGQQSEHCQDAALKVVYIEVRVGVVPGHTVNVYCTKDGYAAAIEKLGVSYPQAPDGVSLLKARITFLNADSVLRTDGDNRHRGNFLVAHEIGHFATDSPFEWQADSWAAQALKKYVPVSYEDFKRRREVAKK